MIAAAQPRIVSPVPIRALLLALAACAHAPDPSRGSTKANAVEVCLTRGLKQYLDQWRCPGGGKPQINRLGAVGMRTEPVDPNDPRILLEMDPEVPIRPGEPDFHIVDAVQMRCADLTYTLFIDMYHCAPAQ